MAAFKFSKRSSNLFLLTNLFCYILLATACGTCGRGGGSRGGTRPSAPGVPGGPTTGGGATCPRDALKLGVCANLLGGLVGVVIGSPPTLPCCTLLAGLADLEAAVCLCTAIRANVLGINLNVPVSLSLLLNVCGRTPPTGFTCA